MVVIIFCIIVILCVLLSHVLQDVEQFSSQNLVVITSVIHTVNSPLSYSDVRSTQTHSERYNHTIQTIHSIYEHVPNPYIVLIEGSALTNNEIDGFYKAGVHKIHFVAKDLKQYINGPHKSVAEVKMLLHYFDTHDVSGYNSISKISGRYYLGSNFSWNKHPLDKPLFQCDNEFVCNTRFYRIPQSYFSEYKKSLESTLENNNFVSGSLDIERYNIFKVFSDSTRLMRGQDDVLGVMGVLAPYGQTIEDFDAQSHIDKRIPKIVFITSEYHIDQLPDKFKANYQKMQDHNPEYTFAYYDAEQRRRFIEEHHPYALASYNALVPGAYQCDLWRLLVLYTYGGIYIDAGHQFVVPISEILHDDDEFVSVFEVYELGIHNSFICAYPHHPILRRTIDMILDNIENRRYGINTTDITGPTTFQRAYNLCLGLPERHPIPIGRADTPEFKIRFLRHDYREFDQANTYIVDENDRNVIRTKFEGYEEMMYVQGRVKYSVHWENRTVYTDDNVK